MFKKMADNNLLSFLTFMYKVCKNNMIEKNKYISSVKVKKGSITI